MTFVALGDVVEIKGGGTPSKANPAFYTGDIPWVTPKDMKVWDIATSIDKITEEAIKNSATTLVPAGSILVVNRSGILKHTLPVGIARRCVAINQDMKALICGPRVNADYLGHLIKAAEPIVLSWVRATTADNFPIQNLRNLDIPLPPLEEQKRIAAIIDQADALRRLRVRALNRLSALGQALFHEMFGDTEYNPQGFKRVTLSEIIKFVGGTQPPKSQFLYEDGPDRVRFVQTRDFRTDAYKTYLPKELAKRPFTEEDVMIGRYGPPVFQIFRGLSGTYNVALMKAEAKANITRNFIFYLLQEPKLHGHVVSNSERTAGQSGVNLDLLENYEAFLPPRKLIDEFDARTAIIDRQLALCRVGARSAEALLTSLQYRAFRGEL